ncbi:amino acid adenylation domain-containing protein [Nocardia sp. NBC_00508]|uniref:amino acid adenylation domain-containing protein n=1 Tax=Nocardia sp. NBC_00508 TaxID=2975992 RepID=UPI002E81DD2C|nr:amino acid adenylation domain-containing protein [Nocardia sp. NBC_00508]WUD64160.1 amino acid adenylation domain-containing protein [Nocardia sp. NBC_00508]
MSRDRRAPRGRRRVGLLFGSLLTAAVESAAGAVAVRFNPSGDPSDDRQLTYRELDELSSRLARELIAHRIGAGDTVAIGMTRSIESVLAVWAVAKTGAAYVPVDPAYPPERIAHILSDSGAVLGLTVTAHRQALGSGVDWVELDDPAHAARIAERPGHPISYADRVRPVDPRHPAYVIYTSGSTGKPKGVVVTHTGLGALVAAAREALRVHQGSRILHVCSPNFDASVLELLLAFSSGATLVVAPPHAFGGPELADLLRRERVTHIVITPGALESVDPAGLDDLEVVEVGGEECSPDLIGRWARDDRLFVNGYGPTEVTVWATVSGPLRPSEPVTIGSAIAGVGAFVLDARLRPVPAGVIGELYLSGPALAQGYLGRPGLTAERFVASPFGAETGDPSTGRAPGARLYRTGDLVRRNEADGTLEYLGRLDFQVKIRGFRIELGEIDNALTAHPAIDYAATLGKTLPSGAKVLVSYVLPHAGTGVDTEELATFVAGRLPEYMVPAAIVVLDTIPLTPIGKLDRNALPEPAFVGREFRAPVSEAESIIAEVFATVLGVERVGLDDSFFALGGDSILSIQLVARAKARGVVFTARDVFDHRTVAALAEIAALDGTSEQHRLAELPGGGVGAIPLPPIMAGTLANGSSYQRFSQSMALRLPAGIDRATLNATISAVFDHHDVLRARLRRSSEGESLSATAGSVSDAAWLFEALERGAVDVGSLVRRVELPADVDDAELSRRASAEYDAALGRLDPSNAVMVQFVWFAFTGTELDGSADAGSSGRRDVLLVVAHHFVVDGVSWRILLPDLAVAWSQLAGGQPVALPANGTSMRRWAHALVDAAKHPARVAELPFWQQVSATADPALGARAFDPAVDTFATVDRVQVTLSAEVTDAVLTAIPGRYHGGVNDGLLSALALAVSKWRGETSGGTVLVKLEGHGREEDVVAGADLSRTVGWFTSAYPVRLNLAGAAVDAAFEGGKPLGDIVKSVKEQLLAIPDKGLGYGLLRYLNPETAAQLGAAGQISFNYLGRVSAGEIGGELAELGWAPVADLGQLDAEMDPDMPANGVIDLNAIVTDGGDGPRLGASFAFPRGLLSRERVQELADLWVAALAALARHAQRPDAGGLTPSDLPLVTVGQSDIDVWERNYPALSDVWPLSPLQSGLLFHALMAQSGVDVYITQARVDLGGGLDVERLRAAAQAVLDRYPNLRAAFVTDADGQAVQLVMDRVEVPWREVDLTHLPESEQSAQLQRLVALERETHFDMSAAPLMRFTLYRTQGGLSGPASGDTGDVSGESATEPQWHLVITSHHILLDGWSNPLLLRDVLVLYATRGDRSALPRVTSYRNFLSWLAGRDQEASLKVWAEALSGVDEPTQLAPQPQTTEHYEIGKRITEIDADGARRITGRAAELGVTVNTLVQAAWGILLGRLTGRGDVVFGATVSGRPGELTGVESMVGLFINTLPVRVRVDDRLTVGEFLERLQREQAGLLDHHYVGLTDIQRVVGAGAQFDTLLIFESYPIDRDAIAAVSSVDGMSVTGVGLRDDTHYPLTMLVHSASTIELTWKYLGSRFTADEVEALAARLLGVLEALVGDPGARVGAIDILLISGERDRILREWNDTRHPVEPELLLDGYRRAVQAHPDKVAVIYEGRELTYRDFDERVNRLARLLISRGVGAESLVGLAVRRSLDLVVGMYAIITAGGAYVPLDPDHPDERIQHVLNTAEPVCVITTTADAVSVPDGIPVLSIDTEDLDGFDGAPLRAEELSRPVRPDNPAYVIFTSGSTGRPKGVAVSHGAIHNQITWMLAEYPLGVDDVYFQKTATTFDVSLWGYFMPLRVGAKLVVATHDGHRDPVYLSETIAAQRVTVTDFVPSMLAVFAAHTAADAVSTLRHVFAIGEALPPETVAALRAISDAAVHNLYGPTEAAVSITSWQASGGERTRVPIGSPQWNSRVYVLDSRLRPVPAGVPGELYLAGDQLARGYVARPDLTSDRFVADPFGGVGSGGEPGARMYRTGDLVVWREPGRSVGAAPAGLGEGVAEYGVLEYLGRTDFQVKFRGQRIELGDIESALLEQPSVSQAVVVVVPSELGDQLVAYAVPSPGASIDPAQLLPALARTLPAYMVPATAVELAAFPLNTSGKLDRKALPRPTFTGREFRAPSTPIEEIVAGVFADVLGAERVGVDDDFFALGGNSLVATQVVARLSAALDARVSVRTLFDAPVVAELAAGIVPGSGVAASRPPLTRAARPDLVPLSLAQQRMWVLNQVDTESPAYNLPFALRLAGALDVPALRQAVVDVLERHEALRTRFPVHGQDEAPHQEIRSAAETLPDGLEVETVIAADPAWVAKLLSAGFDVTEHPPVRIRLFAGPAPDEHLLVFVVHHISADGSSLAPLARDLVTAYLARIAGTTPNWAPLTVQYADFAVWQRAVIGTEDEESSVAAEQLAYWRRQLAGVSAASQLPLDRPRPAIASLRGASTGVVVPAQVHAGMARIARERNSSLFMVVHAALAALLARLSGGSDIAIGTPIAGRGAAALDDLVGMFVNTLTLRTEVDRAATFAALVDQVRETDLSAFANADIPFERVVEAVLPAPVGAGNPLFQVMLSFQNTEQPSLELPGLTVSALQPDEVVAKFDLQVIIEPRHRADGTPDELVIVFTYATDLFEEATVQRLGWRFERILAAVAADPRAVIGEIDILGAAELVPALTAPVRPARPSPAEQAGVTMLPELLAGAVENNPDGVAVVYADASTRLSEMEYVDLDDRSTRLARLLIARGIGPEDLVAIGIPRSLDSVLAVWAIAKTGAGFVPVDPNYPADRVAHMISDSHAVLGLTIAEVRADLPGELEWLVIDADDVDRQLDDYSAAPVADVDRTRPLRAEHPAYVIYTSGSTGKPKGVVVTQAGLSSFCDEQRERYRVTSTSRTLHFASPSFDASVLELLLAIGGAATMIVAAPTVYGGAELAALLRRERVTHAFITPTALASVDPTGLDKLRVVIAGGEACPPDLVQRWTIPIAGRRTREFYNGYGPTETTIMTNISAPLVPGEAVTIGGPIRGITEYVLDQRLHPVPDLVVGELYITGAQVARGYHERPALTAARFVANPFDPSAARLYRTGDLARRTADGRLEYVGRNDFQVKIRGFRIELGEIDAVLGSNDSVDFAVTIGHKLPTGATILVSYVHAAAGAIARPDELVTFAERSLPAHMVPTTVMVLDEIPLTPVGKLDRAALPVPVLQAREFRAPSGPLEELVAGAFTDLLHAATPVGADDDFFELGGNSLIATRLIARLGAALDSRIPVRLLFEASTVAALAARLGEASTGAGRRPLTAGPRPERIPLSLGQQGMWFLNRLDTASVAYNVPLAVRLSGALDTDALRTAIGDLVARHEILRTIYPHSDSGSAQGPAAPVQVILPVAQAVPQFEIRAVAPAEVADAVVGLASTVFDLTTDMPVRVVLFDLSGAANSGHSSAAPEYVLAMVVHHIAADGSSIGPLTRDLMTAYAARCAGEIPTWAPLPVQYADYSMWQRDLLGAEDDPESLAAKQIAYWKQALAGLPDQLDLPSDRPRPLTRSYAGGLVAVRIDAETHRALTELARTEGATLFMVVHTALAVLLARLSGTDDIAIGSPVAGRGEAVLDDLVGMFINTLVFRTRYDAGETFTDLLGRQRKTDIQAFANADVPFERLVDALKPVRSTARHPLYQVALSFQNMEPVALELPDLTISSLDIGAEVSQFDLHWMVGDAYDGAGAPTGIGGVVSYASDMFDQDTVQGFVDRFVRLLSAIAHDPAAVLGDIDVIDPAERVRLLSDAADTAHPVSARLLLTGFRRAVAATPDAVAVVHDETAWTYREFDARVNRLARYLIGQGIGPESVVAMALPRSPELLVAMYAVLSAGGAYLPLDLDHPAGRIGYVLEVAEPVCVLTDNGDPVPVSGVPVIDVDALDLSAYSAEPVAMGELRAPLHADHPAYVLFTSGSTGRPKGVMVSHGAITNQIEWMAAQYSFGPDDVYLQKTATTFDVSLWGFFVPLWVGARLVLAAPGGQRDPGYIADLIAANRVTVTDFVPSVLQVFLAAATAEQLASLRAVFVIGEALPPSTVADFAALSSAGLHNLYGPTEAAVSVTYWPASTSDRATVPIGVAEWNTRTYVLDSRLHLVPAGVVGELYLAGDQLARGYLRRADLTSDRFVADPYGPPSARMYRTGDLVRRRADGVLEYLGRSDFQAKIRGHRIELGEIEAALLAEPSVAQAVVVVTASENGDQLVAYVVAATDLAADALRESLAQVLPSYMVPSAIMVLDSFPMNDSGKLNRAALPQPVFRARDFVAPATPTEQTVAEAFVEVLAIARAGAEDDFFDLGGTSLLAFTLQRALTARLGIDVPMAALFTAPTVRGLATRIDNLDQPAVVVSADDSATIATDAVLEPEIDGAGARPASSETPMDVLLTGATGFVGVHLLRELLSSTRARVWCLVRSDDDERATKRIRNALEKYRIWDDAYDSRIVAVAGDLAAPRFGLDEFGYARLADRIEVIYHNGARVNHIEPYARLRAANVEGTREVLRLATTGRIKPVHFVSTVNAAIPAAPAPDFRGREDAVLSADEVSQNGYVASKWVAEQLVRQAGERGVPVSIYRPGIVCGDPRTGVNSADDSFWNMIRAAAILGLAPDTGDADMALVPVNYVAGAIVALAAEATNGSAYHLVNSQRVAIRDIFRSLRSHGIPVAIAAVEEIATKLAEEAAARDAAGDDSLVRAALVSGNYGGVAVPVDDTHTRTELAGHGIHCPPIDTAALDAYVESFIDSGFFPVPSDDAHAE